MEKKKRNYSIIVVTFNNIGGLERTLDSIRRLNYDQKEVVVIDGGSTDGTQTLMEKNAALIDVAVSEKDSGIYNAMNKGVARATGDYIVFMNAGDEFAHANVLSTVNNYATDLILGGDIYGGTQRLPKTVMTLYDILSIGICHQAVYYRREVLQRYGFDESYKIIADLKSVVEPLAKDRVTIASIVEPLAVCESGGLSKQRWKDILSEKRRMLEEVIDPFYREDYLRFAYINNSMLDDFIVLSHFHSVFPMLRLLTKMARLLNGIFKHIPL
jgi:glycosyltransferase involved in cell wall biosynthesis